MSKAKILDKYKVSADLNQKVVEFVKKYELGAVADELMDLLADAQAEVVTFVVNNTLDQLRKQWSDVLATQLLLEPRNVQPKRK